MTDIVLYANQISNYCAKVRIVLEYKRIPYTVVPPPDGYGSPAYKKLVPQGTIPAIRHGDFVLSESEAINEYLEEIFPEPALLHGDAQARARQRAFARYHDLTLEPPLRALFGHVAPANRDDAVVAAGTANIQRRVNDLAELGAFEPFIASAQPSLGDIGYPATLRLAELMFAAFGRALSIPPEIAAWRERLIAIPAIAKAVAISEPASEAWIRDKLAIV